MPKQITTKQFIERSKNIHGDKYDYSLTDYIRSKIKVKIICPVHGMFEQRPNDHLSGYGCLKCVKNYKLNTDIFIKRSKIKHNNIYDYSLVNYINYETKVKIICPIHGIFEQTPHHHLNGIKCPNCSHNKKIKLEEFINQCIKTHGNKYDYSLVEYKNSRKNKIKIICKKHGIFEQTPYEHKKGSGCPICNESKGERNIRFILDNKNIKYKYQKKFKDCKYKSILSFDFYLPEYNLCIEFDGVQHETPINIFGGIKGLKIRQKRDQIKNEYCQNNNIRLIRIKHDDNIDKILSDI
ncbi:MAG: hypothetical protein WDA02_03540 [Saccharofermentanales bacterium]